VLRSTDKNSRDLQFELVDPLLKPESQNPPDYAQAVRDAVTPLLRSDSIAQRLLAAYSLAVIPGEKPPELKDIFLEVLQLKGTTEGLYAYRAADGLGLLGPQAKDAVPALLDFANATKDWGASGYAQAALEAACRIEPALRQEYPQIDAKLKQQESGNQPTAIPIPTGQTETPSVNGPEPSSPPLLGLTLDARVLLIDYPTPDKSRLETLLSEWDNYYRSIPGYAAVTTERFNELSQTIEKLDTNFHALWLKEILRSYPNLDRRASVPKK
jgi:hypothetical protein